MSTGRSRRHASEAGVGVAVKYTPCAKGDHLDDDDDNDVEEISIVDRDGLGRGARDDEGGAAASTAGASGEEGNGGLTANGPRILPGLDVYQSPTDRTKLIGERLSSCDKISLSSPIYSNKVVEQKSKSTSKQSLLDLFSTRLDRSRARKRSSIGAGLLKKPRPSEANIITSKSIRKQRRKELQEKFGKKSLRGERIESSTVSSDKDGCNWTFVFDPSGRLCYWWSSVVSVAFLYNFWVIIYRFAFNEINHHNLAIWFTLDYSADFLYVLDVVFHFRTGYLEDGVLQTDPTKLRIHYMNSTTFYIDCLCLLPLDFLYLSIGFRSILRCFRLVKVYRFWMFLDRTERHTNYPNVIRTATLMHYLLALFHWNACLYYLVAHQGFASRSQDTWKFPKDKNNTLIQYLHALYWSTLTLTTIGGLPAPKTTKEYLFTIFELMFALMLFATVLGHVANIVTSVSAARKEFQARLDGVKTYMMMRRVPLKLQDRVIKWFDYLWMCNKSSDEEKALSLLPDKLKAEIAIHVHLDTLKRVEIFQSTEKGFLCELVLRLRPVLFSPGDYICRKDEVGKEMYIVNRGRLHVVADNGKTVLATLKPGSYFGEISILNMGTAGNRRTASVRSVGYSDLFCLSKKDLWDVLKEYPAARVKLEAIAVKRLEKYKKAPLEKAAMARSRSTPGLVESAGKIPLQTAYMARHHTLPPGLTAQRTEERPEDQYAEGPLVKGPTSHSENNILARIEDAERNASSATHEAQGNMTTSMTISTMTSYTSGSPQQQRSPLVLDPNQGKVLFSPPSSPKAPPPHSATALPLITSVCTPIISEPMHPGAMPSHQMPPTQLNPAFPYISQPQMAYLSPYCASPNFPMSPSPNIMFSQSGGLQPSVGGSQSGMASPYPHGAAMYQAHSPLTVTPMGHGAAPSGLASPNPETQSDILLREISRLRERLAQVEEENTALTVKLNQQQWDVESRLAELEMHICQSDSVTSGGSTTDDRGERMVPGNRESII